MQTVATALRMFLNAKLLMEYPRTGNDHEIIGRRQPVVNTYRPRSQVYAINRSSTGVLERAMQVAVL
jgi:hypothetical protein